MSPTKIGNPIYSAFFIFVLVENRIVNDVDIFLVPLVESLGMKWLIVLIIPFLLFASPQEDLYRVFDLPETASLETVQRLWIQQGKERWQFENKYEELREVVWPLFVEMGMVNEIKPARARYETVLVLGALLSTVESRVDYLIDCGVAFDQLVFLTGERPLLDSEKKKLPGLLTESEMVKWVYEQSNLPKSIPALFIDVPMKGEIRPNTLDTIRAWLQTNPHPETCLAISSQPFVHYQEAVLNRWVPFPVEVVGHALIGTRTVALMLDTLAREMTYKYGDIEWLQM